MVTISQRNKIMRALLLLAGLFPLISPIGFPSAVDKYTREFYNVLENLEPGDIVLIEDEFDMGAYSMVGYSAISIIRYLWENGIKFVIYTYQPLGVASMDAVLNEPALDPPANIVYGEDWIYVGFVPGEEVGMANTVTDPWFMNNDRYGNQLSSLPLTEEINHLTDFDLVIFLNKSTFFQTALFQQWITPHKIPAIGAYGSSEFGNMLMFYPELLQGLLNSIEGSISLESLTGKLGKATAYNDAISMIGYYITLLIVAGNVAGFMQKDKTEEVK